VQLYIAGIYRRSGERGERKEGKRRGRKDGEKGSVRKPR